MIRSLFCWALTLALVAPPSFAALVEARLDNGMRVLVKEDRRAPVVASMVWYRCGSMDESTGTTGVAHVLEHMMFKGTEAVPPGQFSKTIARAGGRDNAFTNRDSTVYHQQLHKSQLELALRLEADRMRNLLLPKEEFDKEIRVVMEERRLRTEDQPRSLLYEQFMATAYQAHPYRTPVIGWMRDLENMTVDDARAWYERWYTPANATLVVVGDVAADEVIALAQRYFGSIPSHALPVRKPLSEPIQRGERRVVLQAPAELPQVMLGWHVPALRDVESDWEPYALWVLAAILDANEAARLQSELVRAQKIALAANANYDAVNRGPSQFMLTATPALGRSAQEVEAALRAQVRRLADERVREDELRRTKVQAVATRVFQQDSMFGQAMQFGALSNAGLPPDSIDVQVRKLQEVTAEQVQSVARKYLVDSGLTVATLKPVSSAKQEQGGQ